MATRTPVATSAPVQVSSTLPSLARTRVTKPGTPLLATQMSAPSALRSLGMFPTGVRARAVAFCVVQNWSRAARRERLAWSAPLPS